MAWQALLPVALQGAKALYTAFNKPKSNVPEETLSTIQRMISNQQSDIKSKTLLNMLTSSAKSQGAQQYQQGQHSLDTLLNRGTLSEGQYAKGLQGLSTDVQSAVGQQTGDAVLQQFQQNQSALDKIENARLQIAQIKDSYRQQLKSEQQQWQNELAGNVLDTASTAFNSITQGLEDKAVQTEVDKYVKGIGNKPFGQWSLAEQQGLLSTLMLKKYGVNMPTGGQKCGTHQ